MDEYIKTEKIITNSHLSLCVSHNKFKYIKAKTITEDAHIHSYFEMYINVSGDVSFLVENKLYPIQRGDIIITKPNEMHHCVYNSDCIHDHYCLWIDASGDFADIFKINRKRNKGELNLISMNKADKEKAIELCEDIYQKHKENKIKTSDVFAKLFSFFALTDKYSTGNTKLHLPELFENILKYIDDNLHLECTGKIIASHFFISRSTLYRMFKTYLNMTPAKYIESKRLSLAKAMLENNHTLQEVCTLCGFNDYSHFIATFKKRFGITPHKYLKSFK